MEMRSSRTEKNLMAAFAGESQARNRYGYFAGTAREEGYMQIAGIFEETANQEKEHAKRFFSLLKGGEVEIRTSFPAGVIGTTAENLRAAARGEREEWTELYPHFAKIAREEGFANVAPIFEAIVAAEKQHEKRYAELLTSVEAGTVFKKDRPVVWQCRNCGYTHEGEQAPKVCSACAHPQGYFELLGENYQA